MKLFLRNSKLFVVLLALTLGAGTAAKDFKLKALPQASDPTYDLADVSGDMTYYDFMEKTLGKEMLVQSGNAQPSRTNEDVLKEGGGISVRLGEKNYNVHINFPNSKTGGRSYGWTSGQVGDWSDAMYLDHLYEVVTQSDDADIRDFYEVVVNMLGSCNSDGIDSLNFVTQRVATNFLAIYTAEQYRAIVAPGTDWDDAILQVTLLGAFHGGQDTYQMYYVGEFTNKTKEQESGVYNRGRPGQLFHQADDKKAVMRDYWQFSSNPTSRQSGINLTRNDFKKMGEAITRYEADNKTMQKIQDIVGETDNVFNAIAIYFTDGDADKRDTAALAKLIPDFMMDIRAHANDITEWIKADARSQKEDRR